MKAQLELYKELVRKYLGLEVKLRSKFQIHVLEWSFIGRYSNGEPRFLIGFPVDFGVRVLVEVGGDKEEIRQYMQWIRDLVKRDNVGDLRRVMIPFFEKVVKNARQFFVECVQGDVAVRLRARSRDELAKTIDHCLKMASLAGT